MVRLKSLLTIVSMLGLCACASAPKTAVISHFSDTANREFVLLTETDLDTDLRIEMAKRNFAVKKFATSGKLENQYTSTKKITTNQAAARYALSFQKAKTVDWCPWNDQKEVSVVVEISDLQKNEVLMVVKATDWTGLCGPFSIKSKYLIEKIADEIDNAWRAQELRAASN